MFVEIHKEMVNALPFVLSTVGFCDHQAPVFRPTGFEAHQLIWVTDGSGSFSVGTEVFTLQAGEGMFFRANLPHSYQGKHLSTAWCTFYLSEKILDYLEVPEWFRFCTPKNQDFENRQLQAFAEGDSTVLTRSAAGYSYVIDFFTHVLPADDSPVAQVLRILERCYGEPLALAELAEAVHMDRYALCRAYKSARGVTIMEDLQRIRIAKAKRLLKYSADPIEAVGELCGFESASYFGKRFRESVGCTPGDYRRRFSK